mgnify:CR=1 FL=1
MFKINLSKINLPIDISNYDTLPDENYYVLIDDVNNIVEGKINIDISKLDEIKIIKIIRNILYANELYVYGNVGAYYERFLLKNIDCVYRHRRRIYFVAFNKTYNYKSDIFSLRGNLLLFGFKKTKKDMWINPLSERIKKESCLDSKEKKYLYDNIYF